MKKLIAIIAIIVLEACGLIWVLGDENDKLKAENSTLKHQLAYQRDKNAELQWVITKMDLVIAGKAIDEIFQSEKVETPDENDKISDDDNENVIYID